MKSIWLLALTLIIGCNTSQKTVSENTVDKDVAIDPDFYAQTITEEELKEHLYTYASDEFEGRETGEEGQKKAVQYLKENYQQLEISAARENGDYFQDVPLEMAKLPTGSIEVDGQMYEIGQDFVAFSAAQATYSEIVYVGFGIDHEAYSDYDAIDVSNKLVLIKAGEPTNEDGTYKISGTKEKSEWGKDADAISIKRQVAKENGAKAIMYFDPSNYSRYRGYYNFMDSSNDGRMSLKEKGENPPLILLNGKNGKNHFT